LDRAYSVLTIKSIDAERRTFAGVATTPTPDRSGDIIEPLGVSFKNPLPLLLHHDQRTPVGHATFSNPTPSGITFEASIPFIDEPGTVKTRIDEAWHSVKTGLIRGVSVGVRALKKDVEALKEGGLRFLKSEVFELSLVVIPANVEATITAVKSFDQAATGHSLSPGASGSLPVVRAVKAAPAMANTIQDQITAFENTRAAKSARITELMTKASDAGVTLDDAQSEEYETLKGEVKAVDAHLVRLHELEKMNIATASPVTRTTDTLKASELRGGTSVVQVKANVPKGTAFTRYMMAKIVGKNSISDAIAYVEANKVWMDQTPEVLLALKAAVNPGTIAEPAWAAPLAVARPMQEEFLELLRPATLLGKIPGLRQVPFNISVPIQTGGGTYAWVGEGAPKPVGQLQFAAVTLGVTKAAGIIVISEELAKVSNPSAEQVVRNDMIRGMAQYLDVQFIDPTIAAAANVSPASITNLANGFATAGTSGDNARTDIKKAITLLTQANYPISETVLIMSEANAFALSVALTSNGVLVNPGLTAKGGTILGLTTVTSQAVGQVVALVHAPSILFADDGGVNIDVSREATVEMNTTPTSPITAASVYVSLWQANLIGLRAERFINWKRARTTSVVYTTATYV
jgi:HK97 family phage major capsid protein/HK97 family phage prohead protease